MQSTGHARMAPWQAVRRSQGTASWRGQPQRHSEVHVAGEKRPSDVRARRAQMFLGHTRDPRIGNAVYELPQVILDSGAELPGEPTPLILLLMNIAERGLDMWRRDAEAPANDWRTAARAQRGKPIRDIAEQEVEAVRLLERAQFRGARIDLRNSLGVRPLDLRAEGPTIASRHEANAHAVVPGRPERLALVRHIVQRERCSRG